MKRLPLFALLLLLAVATAPIAFAQPVQVVQTDCDTLGFAPPEVRVSFAVINLGPIPVCSIHLTPIQSGPTPADSCRVLSCEGAPGWQCTVDAAGGGHWVIDPALPPGCILTGQKHEPFTMVLDPLYCCYEATFDDPSGNIFYRTVVCFECVKPVAARQSTWGELKSFYR